MNKVWSLSKETFHEWSQDNVSRLAAALAYYTIFSVAPLLVIVISIVGMVANRLYGPKTAQHEVYRQVRGLVGEDGAHMIGSMVKNAAQTGSGLAMAIGIALLLYGSTNVFSSLQDSLNTIWEVKPRPGLGIVQTMRNRLLSFTMVLVIAFLLMVSLVISIALSAATTEMFGTVPSILSRATELVVSVGLFTAIFAAIYKILPDVRIGWRSVWVGAFLTAVLFTIGKYLIGLYLGRSAATSIYGTAGSLVAVILWVYYAAQILFFGAEFTYVYSKHRLGRTAPAAPDAVKLTEAERVQQGVPKDATVARAVAATDSRRVIRPVPVRNASTPYLAAAAGLMAGFLAGGASGLIRGRDRAIRDAVTQRTNERIRLLHARLKQGEHLSSYLREADANDRLDLIERRLRRVNDVV